MSSTASIVREAQQILNGGVAPETDMEYIAYAQALATVALAREARVANLIAFNRARRHLPHAIFKAVAEELDWFKIVEEES